MKIISTSKRIVFLSLFLMTGFLTVRAQDYKNSFKFNFSPTGGYRILVDDSATNLLPAFRNYETMRFGMSGTFEYTRSLKKWISISIGFEYQYFEYGGSLPFSTYDSINNYSQAGTLKTSYVHHYLGLPIKFYFNMVNKEKFRLYTFIGFNPKLAVGREYGTEYTDTIHNTVFSFHELDPEAANSNYQRNVFNIEGQVGLGFNFNISKRLYLDLNGFFGMNMLRSNRNTPINDYVYRAGGTVGLGYFF